MCIRDRYMGGPCRRISIASGLIENVEGFRPSISISTTQREPIILKVKDLFSGRRSLVSAGGPGTSPTHKNSQERGLVAKDKPKRNHKKKDIKMRAPTRTIDNKEKIVVIVVAQTRVVDGLMLPTTEEYKKKKNS
eukprot:TRINITY_DN12417_c0_g1_i2.p2 TRINITY_DN12417_c0_g1~~TRINITY_DN12417_c0_g1_i2.p2  ORF type:complete len:155 (-),score=23.90 TRINITY_DN12417_c0_g1_i2:455-859(-)